MAVAISACGAALASSVTAEPYVAFFAGEPFYDEFSEPIFDLPRCNAALKAQESKFDFMATIVSPANDNLALLYNMTDSWGTREASKSFRVGILDCMAEETSWSILDLDQAEVINPVFEGDNFSEDLGRLLNEMLSDPELGFVSAPNNVAESCVCAFLASDAWPKFKQDFIADPSNYSAGGN